jgi:predicted SAM-dependent methyltransferase
MELIKFENTDYLKFQSLGNASQFAIPFAKQVCFGEGYDIGCMKIEWSLPGSIPIDLEFDDPWDANNLPDKQVDYIFSSHCLEHVDDWVFTLDYWYDKLVSGGILFLYLPDFSQRYWRPWNNKKHKHVFTPEIISEYLKYKKYKNIFVSGIDLNSSFMCVCEK